MPDCTQPTIFRPASCTPMDKVHPCSLPKRSGKKKISCFNFLFDYLLCLDTCSLYYKGISAFIFERITVLEILCNNAKKRALYMVKYSSTQVIGLQQTASRVSVWTPFCPALKLVSFIPLSPAASLYLSSPWCSSLGCSPSSGTKRAQLAVVGL